MPLDHPVFKQPDDRNVKIWRYTSLDKFISMLMANSLYFSRLDYYNDPLEGSLPVNNLNDEIRMFGQFLPSPNINSLNNSREASKNLRKMQVKYSFSNCWHISDYESGAMWGIYGGEQKGIAIQSTYDTLWNCLPDTDGNEAIFMGIVNYIDYDTDVLPSNNTLFPLVYKRKSFEWEKEVRAVIVYLNDLAEAANNGEYSSEHPLNGIEVYLGKEKIRTLIQKIYIAPFSPDYYESVVRDVIEKYDLNPDLVYRSKINIDPIY